MPKRHPQTALGWIPSAQQWEVIDLLASGYSQQAVSRALEMPVSTISAWLHERDFSDQFRELVVKRTGEFQAAKDAVHDQQVVMALQVLQDALSGDLQRERGRDGATGPAPLRYEAAIELLRATFWKQRAGGHKPFGAS